MFNLKTYQGYITKYSLEREVIWSNNPNVQNNIASRTTTLCTISIVEECCHKYSGNPTGACHPRGPRCNGPFNTVNVETCISLPGGGSNTGNEGEGNYVGGSNTNEDDCQTSGTNILDGQPIAGIGGDCAPNAEVGVKPPTGDNAPTEDENNENHEENCLELNRLSASAYTQVAFSELESSLSEDHETGFAFKLTNTFPFIETPMPQLQTAGYDKLKNPTAPLYYAVMHNHYIGKFEMFGHGDIHSLYSLSQTFNFDLANTIDENGTVIGDPFTYDISQITLFMTERNNTYAIKIEDITKLTSIQEHFVNKKTIEKFKKELEKVYYNVHSNPELANQNDLTKAFLKFVTETYDFGISLYKTPNNDITTGSSNWEKLTLDPTDTDDGIKETPCN